MIGRTKKNVGLARAIPFLAIIFWRVSLAEETSGAVTWKQVTPNAAFQPRDSCGEAVFKDRMWIMGGWYDSKTTQELRDVWSSADGVNWKRVTEQAPWTHPQHPVTLVFDNKLWMMSGYQGGRLPGAGQTSEVWWTEDGRDWTKAATAPWAPRFAAGGIVFDGKMWILGGAQFPQGASTDTAIAFNDVWNSADGSHWTKVTEHAPWSARGYQRVLAYDNQLWLLGGGNYRTSAGKIIVNNDVWSSADGKEWTRITQHADWSPRIWHEAIVYNDRMWILGGGSSDKTRLLNDAWHSRDGLNWTESKSASIWSPRHEMSVYDFRGKLWVVAGAVPTKAGLANDVWQAETSSSSRSGVSNHQSD